MGLYCGGGAAKSYVRKVQIMQKQLIKIILNKNSRYPSANVFKYFNVKSIQQLFLFHSCMHVFNKGVCEKHLASFEKTRNYAKSGIVLPKTNTEFYKRNAYVQALKFFYDRNINLCSFTNVLNFKKMLNGCFKT